MPNVPEICIICDSSPASIVLNGLDMWKCPKCLLMWRQSFDVPISHYEEADGGFSGAKEFLQRRNIRDRIRVITKYLKLDNTCDIGGSKGYFVEELIKSGFKGSYGVDPNKIQIEAAQRRGVPMIAGTTADIKKIFPEKKTKNVTLFHVIEHLPNPIKTISEIYDALPSGGYFVVETPDFDSYAFKKLDYKHKLVYEEHLFYFNTENLKKFLKKIGFGIIHSEKRDFDQYHLNVRESLFRLGIMNKEKTQNILEKIIFKTLNTFFAVPFSFLVKLLERGSFTFVVSRKNKI